MLMRMGGEDRANLRSMMEKSRNLDDAVIFIDEFEEIAGSRMKEAGWISHHQ